MGLVKWIKKGKKGNEALNTKGSKVPGICPDIPVNLPYVFEVNGIEFVGSYIGSQFGYLQFIVREGLLTVDMTADVRLIRVATTGETRYLLDTNYKVNHDHVVRFLQLKDIVAS